MHVDGNFENNDIKRTHTGFPSKNIILHSNTIVAIPSIDYTDVLTINSEPLSQASSFRAIGGLVIWPGYIAVLVGCVAVNAKLQRKRAPLV